MVKPILYQLTFKEDYKMTKTQENLINLATRYTKKLGEEIVEKKLYLLALSWRTTSGREFRFSTSEMNCKKHSYLYLSEKVNGKWVRIPRTQW